MKNLIEQAVRDYEHRAVLELIQNAYDAQPADTRDARILIRLDKDEGEFGTLIVANTGVPFSRSNFDAICDVAQSDKKADEGIGNKGIGFKSVLQLSRVPEVYSTPPDGKSKRFDGYCFRFVEWDDLVDLTAGDDRKARLLEEEVFHLFLPLPLTAVADSIRDLAEDGYVTVVRLPLKSHAALEEAEAELEQLEAGPPPLLFLSRIAGVVVEEVEEGKATHWTLERSETALPGPDPETSVSEVQLGSSSRFLVAERRVDKRRFKESIDISIAQERIGKGWQSWEGDAHVGIAVPLDDELDGGRLYTFLPMGERTEAPLPCHVNAPFFAKLARVDLEETVPLNDFLLDQVADLAAALVLAASKGDLHIQPAVIADLLSWSNPGYERLQRAFDDRGADMALTPLLPRHWPDGSWGSADTVRVWEADDKRIFTPSAVARTRKVDVLHSAIQGDRLDRLDRSIRLMIGNGLAPSDEEVADCAEAVAKKGAQRGSKPSWWQDFYDELADLISGHETLRGRRVLLDDDGGLQRCWDPDAKRAGPTPFFSPRSVHLDDEEEPVDIRIPPTLKRRIFFVNQQLSWTKSVGSSRVHTAGRRMLEGADLVKAYHSGELFPVIRRALDGRPSDARCRDTLKWVYDFVKSRDDVPWAEIERGGIRVPVATGKWVPADQALFSREWGSLEDEALADLVERMGDLSDELEALRDRFLAPPDDWPLDLNDRAAFREFLSRLGVQAGLHPVPIPRSELSDDGHRFESLDAIRRVPLPQQTRDQWMESLEAYTPSQTRPYTNYRSTTRELYRLPGQDEYTSFDDQARRIYAQLILRGLERWDDETLDVDIRRYNDSRDRFTWPTPAKAFLEVSDWMPMSKPAEREVWHYTQPANCWTDATTDDATRLFAPLLPFQLRRELESRPQAAERLRDLGLRYWDDADTASSRLGALVDLVSGGLVPETATAAVKNAYERAWEDLVGTSAVTSLEETAEVNALLITRRGHLEVLPFDEGGAEAVYVQDTDSTQSLRLLEQRGSALLTFKTRIGGEVAGLLTEQLGQRIRLTSQTGVGVWADGEEFRAGPVGKLLVADREWLVDLIAALVETRSGRFRRFGPSAMGRIVDTLRRVRLVFAQRLEIFIDGIPTGTTGSVVAVPHDDYPTILITKDQNPGDVLQSAAPALAELLEVPEVSDSIRISLIDLERSGWLESGNPPLPAIADTVGVSQHRLREITALGKQRMLQLGSALIPVVAVTAPALGEALADEIEGLPDETAVRGWLNSRLNASEADKLLGACHPGDLNRTRENLGIPLPALNSAIAKLGPPFERLENVHGIQHAFEYRKRTLSDGILASVRSAFISDYQSGRPLEEYIAKRDLSSLEPDPTWFETRYTIDNETIDRHIDGWLAEVGAPPLGESGDWPPLDELRRSNTETLREVVDQAGVIVAAWESRTSRQPSELPGPVDEVVEEAYLAGWLDFEPVKQETVIRRLAAVGRWPNDMPQTVDADQLGLSPRKLSAARNHIDAAERRRNEDAQKIRLDDVVLDAHPRNYQTIAESVRQGVSAKTLSAPAQEASLSPWIPKPDSRSRSKGPVTAARRERLSEAQAAAVGLAGEIVAFEWLKVHYQGVDEVSWVSGYKNLMYGGEQGDDSLGYDFEVITETERLLFEVKATTGDTCEIQLTDTEIRAAQGATDRERYNLIFITKVLSGEERSLYLLPNPFSSEAAGQYQTLGTGLRLRFEFE